MSWSCFYDVETYEHEAYQSSRSECIAEARRRRGVTPERMAEDLGLDRVCAMAIETDAHVLEIYPCEVLLSVAAYLRIPSQYLLDPPEY